uniref:GATA-type domain-containing protein n=1 Tax=Meloidogyne enterolobii TaxID=390850 RepID=A0A6V7UPL7_MELEN|nr:unnamed protein product [Meloidogyne enterolobii]
MKEIYKIVFNCGAEQSKRLNKYLKEQFLCHVCGEYRRRSGKLRPKEMWFKTKKRITQDRKCCICETTSTYLWYCHSEPENYLCKQCYDKQYRAMIKTKTERKNTNK